MKRETCYALLIGARQTTGKGKRFPASDEALLQEITRKHFPKGFTILSGKGGWFDAAQEKFIEEESRQILVCTDRRDVLKPWCRELARAFHQKEILVTAMGRAIPFRFRFS